ncbi:MAG: hypothetical protein ACP5NZ_01740 [Nanobdellota archaeon]
MKKANFSPVNLHLTSNEDIFNEKGILYDYFGVIRENRIHKENKRLDPRFSRKRRLEN